MKAIGDAVMFTAPHPVAGAAAALELIERAQDDPELPPLRAGVASGPGLRHHADVFGRTVNIAARLCDTAGAARVLVYGAGPGTGWQEAGLELGAPRMIRLRGLREPVEVVEVRRATPAVTAAG